MADEQQSLSAEKKSKSINYAVLKKGGFMRQKKKGYFSMRLSVVGGYMTSENIRTVSEVAEKYGHGYVHMTSRQGIEIPFIYVDDIEDATVERYGKGFEAVQALLQDKVDAVMIDNQPAQVFVSQNEGIKVVDEAFTVEEYAAAIAKDNTELLDQVNDAIAELEESGELQAIIDKYITD